MAKGPIGVFDSGLGGLLMLRALAKQLPQYDYLYLGDTKRVPYGDRSQAVIYRFLEEAVSFLFDQGCAFVIVACNTASASALRRIQQEYLPHYYPGKKVLGIIIPTAEAARRAKRVGVLATQATVTSQAFVREIKKLNSQAEIFQEAAPRLVPIIESGLLAESGPWLKKYLAPLLLRDIDTLILGCTHYSMLKNAIRAVVGPSIRIIAQNGILPGKTKLYLARHLEIARNISRSGRTVLMVTKNNKRYQALSEQWFTKNGKGNKEYSLQEVRLLSKRKR